MSRALRLALVAAVVALVAAPGAARASATRDLHRARAQYRKLEFTAALKTYRRVVTEADASPDELAAAYLGQGFCLVALGRDADARRALRRAFTVSPELAVPKDLSPKLLAVIDTARKESGAGLVAVHASPGGSAAAPQISVRIRDPRHRVTGVVVHYRALGTRAWKRATAVQVGVHRWSATLTEGGALELWIEALNRYGLAAGHQGTRPSPWPLTLPGGTPKAVAAKASQLAPKKPVATVAAKAARPAPHEPAATAAAKTTRPAPDEPVATTAPKAAPSKPAATASTTTLAAREIPPPPAANDTGDHPPPAIAPPARAAPHPLRPFAYASAGVGLAAVGAGIYFLLQSRSLANTVNTRDPSQFTNQDQALAMAATSQTDATVATACFIGGGVLAATGVGLFVVHAPPADTGDGGDAFSLTATPTPGGGMVLVSGTLPF